MLTATAHIIDGSEARLQRALQTVSIPVFQFGIFSENDLSYFAGPDFNFGGRVHTNANLYLAEGDGKTLTLNNRVGAVGEVIRTHLANGWGTGTSYTGTVNVAKAPNVLRALGTNEGSLLNTLGSAQNEPTWTNLSLSTYNGNIRNSRTGARNLQLSFTSLGGVPIDLIKRPVAGENPLLSAQRMFSQASLRILLGDTANSITNTPGVSAAAPVWLGCLGRMRRRHRNPRLRHQRYPSAVCGVHGRCRQRLPQPGRHPAARRLPQDSSTGIQPTSGPTSRWRS